ncbi:Gfo/Idh/MocA family oxidoreductase [Azospirillum sp. B21]|uniref:Gfo/Idh/MocA family protein n=1 Tax=Azospirillum sp. B21 TaxID=2607496 RepID=UPI0011EC9E5B|nr:Gfo/Idh/MocA family oxidoreductase [Azospirillum sp. B21]KAA0577863.1 Gfo/Idh/MocA family oxidoreductase [Azospirillum sp. B21]
MKAAIIGLGRMGLRHVAVARGLGLDVVGAADPRAEARAAAKSQFDLPDGAMFEDAEAMLAGTRPDCVVVASTAPSHARLTCAAVEAGARLILCEKPMAVSLDDCDRMIDRCRDAGVRLAVNHQMRFMDQYIRPRAIVDAPSFGGLASMTVVAGNFGLAMNGSHYVEAFRFMTGEAPRTVAAWLSSEAVPNPRGAEFSDAGGCLRLTTASGRRFYLEAGTDQGHGMMAVYAGRYGRLEVDELSGRMRLATRAPQDRDLPTTRYGTAPLLEESDIPPADALEPTRAVLQALLAGENHPDGEVGRMAVRVLLAAAVSHEAGGREIDLDSADLPGSRVFAWA